jgi:DNA-binding NarL/FixJ family response regulator
VFTRTATPRQSPNGYTADVPRARIAVVDGNAALAGVLAELLADEPGFEVVGTAVTGAQATALARQCTADVFLVDERLDEALSDEVLDALRTACPSAAVVLWSHHPVHTVAERVDAVVQRGLTFRELARVLRRVVQDRPDVVDLRAAEGHRATDRATGSA